MKTKATIVIDTGIWKEFRKLCIDEEKAYSEMIEELIRRRMRH